MLIAESVHRAPFPLPLPQHILVLLHLDNATLLVVTCLQPLSSCPSSSSCCTCNQKKKRNTRAHTHRVDGVIHLLRLKGIQRLPITHKVQVSNCGVRSPHQVGPVGISNLIFHCSTHQCFSKYGRWAPELAFWGACEKSQSYWFRVFWQAFKAIFMQT